MSSTTTKRREIFQKAADYLTQELGCARALILDVVRKDSGASLKPVVAVGLSSPDPWQDPAIEAAMLDGVFSTRQLKVEADRVCLPVTNHRGQAAMLVYGANPRAPFPADVSERMARLSQELSQALERSVEIHTPESGSSIRPGTLVAGRFLVDNQFLLCRFSTLYKAQDRATGSNLILRHLEDPDKSREARLQTLREGRTLHGLRHRNLPRVLDVVEDSGDIHVVLEDIAGSTIQDAVAAGGPVHHELIRRYLKQMLSVLGYLHGQPTPIVHRDLRPDTVVVTRHGVLKIAEFGLAKMGEDSGQGGRQQTAFKAYGHPSYAAPEQLLGDASHPRNDLYAAGAVLYFMATGQAPPEARRRYTGELGLPSIRATRPEFPADLQEVIERLMLVDPKERPQSVADVLAWLEPKAEVVAEEMHVPEVLSLPETVAEATAEVAEEEHHAPGASRKLSMWKLLFGKKKEEKQQTQSSPTSAPLASGQVDTSKLRVPQVDLSQLELNKEIGRLLPEATARAIGGICIGQISPTEITVVVRDPSDVHIYDAISVGTRGLFTPIIMAGDPDLIQHAQEFIYRSDQLGSETNWLKFIDLKRLHHEALTVTSQSAEVTFGDEAIAGPIVAAVDQLIKEAIAAGASDLHLEPYETGMDLRYRIDGVLRKVNHYRPQDAQAVVKRIKVMGNMDIAQERITQGGRISIKIGGQEFDLRVSVIPVPVGESVVMRVLKKGAFTLQLSDLGFDEEKEERFRNVLSQPYGMILVCGPTGSGKSTSLYASLKEIARPDRKLLTVEDPIEYQMPGIMQVQVNMAPREEEKKVTFSKALREFLRQDPDVILVGEIRDPETAAIAVQAALTGHLLLSTIHTNDSIGIVARLKDMGCEPFLIGSTLLAGLAQRLARRICPNCKHEVPVDDQVKKLFAEEGVSDPKMFEGKGCTSCHGTGNKGRVGLYELLEVTTEIRTLINSGALEHEIRKCAISQGFKPLLVDGLEKVKRGMVTIDEVLRVCKTL